MNSQTPAWLAALVDRTTDFGRHTSQMACDVWRLHISDVPGEQRSRTELASNEAAAQSAHTLDLSRSGQMFLGKITYVQPYTNWYRVQGDRLHGDIGCCRISEAGLLPFSVRDTAPIPIGSDVVVWQPAEFDYGFILGSIPTQMRSGMLSFADWISQGSGVGFKREEYYHGIFDKVVAEGGIRDFSNQRPLDALSAGEWGRLTDLGGGIHIDPFLVFLRQDESCGLFLHYLDRLTRLSGYNFDLRTAVSELTVRNDHSEALHHQGFALYPWEALGALTFGAETSREVSDEDVHYSAPYGKIEPSADDQQPFYRYEEYRGYLGQAAMRHVAAPPSSGTLLQYGQSQLLPGLFREAIGPDGSFSLASAHSIVLEKRSLIPIPKRIRLPEAPNGDGADSQPYRFSGMTSEGEEHRVRDMRATDEHATAQEHLSLADFAAHALQWKPVHPFYYHQGDFAVPDTDEMQPFTAIQEPLNFSALRTSQFLPEPDARQINIDHRYGQVDYFERRAGVYLTPRGGIVIRAGDGSEIRLGDGSIRLSAPGDIYVQSGRHTVVMSGDDCVIKANNSVDVVANNKDVRIKAEINMDLMSGNAGYGRMLLENKAEGEIHNYSDMKGEDIAGSGIILKASQSQVVSLASEIYLRTGGQEALYTGAIVLDAGQGDGDIRTISNSYLRYLNNVAIDTFPVGEDVKVANIFGANDAQIHTPLQVDGGLYVLKDGAVISGNVNIVDGHVATDKAKQYKYMLGEVKGTSLQLVRTAIANLDSSIAQIKKQAETDYEEAVNQRYYVPDNAVGSDQFQADVGFGFRTAEQMKTEEFFLPQCYWQQLAAAGQSSGSTWTENTVMYQGEEMMAFPGKDAWEGETMLTVETNLFEADTGTEVRRDSGEYDQADMPAVQKEVPQGNYQVTA